MSDWKPELYLKFQNERTQPSVDLAARIAAEAPRRILDLGCGPGNSTAVLKARWPRAEITGVDSSPAMIENARAQDGDIRWLCADAAGDLSALGPFDVVFSNAALQWMPDHPALLARWFALLAPGGTLAVQIPYTARMPVRLVMEELEASDAWASRFSGVVSRYSTRDAGYYYDILSGLDGALSLWVTEYIHVMQTHRDIVEWYSGTGLRPFLDALDGGADSAAFLEEFHSALKTAYPLQRDGRVLFPFSRIFFTLRKPDAPQGA